VIHLVLGRCAWYLNNLVPSFGPSIYLAQLPQYFKKQRPSNGWVVKNVLQAKQNDREFITGETSI